MDFDSIDERTAFKLGFAQRCFELGFEPAEVHAALEKQANPLPAIGNILRGAGPWIARNASRAWPWLKGLGAAAAVPAAAAGGFMMNGGTAAAINALSNLGGWGIGLSGGAGLLGGAALGHLAAKMNEEDVDEDAIKSKELADTYSAYSDRLRAQKAYQEYKKQRAAQL